MNHLTHVFRFYHVEALQFVWVLVTVHILDLADRYREMLCTVLSNRENSGILWFTICSRGCGTSATKFFELFPIET